MPRSSRVVAIGYPHHITQRGNSGQKVFFDNEDRERYLSWIQEYGDKYKLSMLNYSLMDNHVHYIGIPHKDDSLARTFNTAHMRYAQYFNKKNKRSGHLWQGRFFSCILDETHLIAAARYIERNPVRAGLVEKPWEWKWSSAQAHTKRGEPLLKLSNLFDFIEMPQSEWRQYIDAREDEKFVNAMRKHTLTGRPLGTIQFIAGLEKKSGRKFPGLERGRPKKNE